MNNIALTGVITQVFPVMEGVSSRGNAWAKGSFLIQHQQGQYPRHLVFEVFGQDKLDEFNLQVGDKVTVSLNLDAHENPKKPGQWFNEVRCWRVSRGTSSVQAPSQQPLQAQPEYEIQPSGIEARESLFPTPSMSPVPQVDDQEDDQLPF